MFFNSIKNVRELSWLDSIKELNRLRKKINRLLSKGM